MSGKSDFGSPTTTTSYELCVYDQSGGTPALVMRVRAFAGGVCAGVDCWRETNSGFLFKDLNMDPDGAFKLKLKASGNGKGKIQVRGKGPFLSIPPLPLSQDPSVLVQILNSDGNCWEANFNAPAKQNTADRFTDIVR